MRKKYVVNVCKRQWVLVCADEGSRDLVSTMPIM